MASGCVAGSGRGVGGGGGGGPEVGEKSPGERRRQVARSWQEFSASGDQKKFS
jgi:hypothetical protein